MAYSAFAVFIVACAILALTPGPSMVLLLANSARYGARVGMFTWGGNICGLCLLVLIATLGMNSIMVFMSEWFDWLRWVGAIYLVWLGAKAIWGALTDKASDQGVTRHERHYFRQGLFIAISNPKVLLFLGAFFPQFINENSNITSQLVLLAVTFIMVMGVVDIICVALASRISNLASGYRRRFADGISGSLLILGGVWLATMRKS